MSTLGPFGYTGGWTTATGPYDCPNDCYIDAQNVEFVGGRLQKRNGNKIWTNLHPGLTSTFSPIAYYQSYLVVAGGGKVAYRSPSTDIVTNWTDITAGTPPAANMWVAELNNILVIGGSDQVPVKWTGTGNVAVLGGTPPTDSTCGAMANNYLFIAGNSTYPWRLFWSNVIDPETWPATSYVDVKKDDNTKITAVFPFGEDLLIFKKNCVARFYTNQLSGTLGPLVIINETIGANSTNPYGPMINRLPDGRVIFLGSDLHIYIYDGNTFFDISNAPYPSSNINSLFTTSIMANMRSIAVYSPKNQIWFSCTATYVNPKGDSYYAVIFIYDYLRNIWVSAYPDHGLSSSLSYTVGGTNFIVGMGGDRYMYREDFGGSNNDQSGSSTNYFGAYATKTLVVGGDGRSFVPRSYVQDIASASFTGNFYYGYNGYANPLSSFTYIYSNTVSTDYKKVFMLSAPSSGINTFQTRFNGTLSNQGFVISPFYLSEEIEVQS